MDLFFRRLKEWCEDNQISFVSIEEGTCLPKGSLKRWKTSEPSGEKILRVANFLDISVDYLLGNSDNPKSHQKSGSYFPVVEQLTQVIKTITATTGQAATHAEEEMQSILEANGINCHKGPVK